MGGYAELYELPRAPVHARMFAPRPRRAWRAWPVRCPGARGRRANPCSGAARARAALTVEIRAPNSGFPPRRPLHLAGAPARVGLPRRQVVAATAIRVEAVRELAPGLWHWTARHEHIGADVSSYYLARERVLIDAMLPSEGLEWFEEHGAPEHVLLTNRHHDRHAWRLREAYGCAVHCVRNGLHELRGRGSAQPFDFGDELPGGVVAHEVDAICPDE